MIDSRFVCIESPLSGDFERNIRFARYCLLDCLRRGEAPFASHLLYPQCLDDRNPQQRDLGIMAGILIGTLMGTRAVYKNLGISSGMKIGIMWAKEFGQKIEYRSLPASLWVPFEAGIPAGNPTPGACDD